MPPLVRGCMNPDLPWLYAALLSPVVLSIVLNIDSIDPFIFFEEVDVEAVAGFLNRKQGSIFCLLFLR